MKKLRNLWQKDMPEEATIEHAHLGVKFEYYFMGKPQRYEKSPMVELLIETRVIDHANHLYVRKSKHLFRRPEVRNNIKLRIEEHLDDLGVDRGQINGMLRYFVVDNAHCKPYDEYRFALWRNPVQ